MCKKAQALKLDGQKSASNDTFLAEKVIGEVSGSSYHDNDQNMHHEIWPLGIGYL